MKVSLVTFDIILEGQSTVWTVLKSFCEMFFNTCFMENVPAMSLEQFIFTMHFISAN